MRRLIILLALLLTACGGALPSGPLAANDPYATRAIAQAQQAGADAAIQATGASFSQTESARQAAIVQATMDAGKLLDQATQQYIRNQGTKQALENEALAASATDKAAQSTQAAQVSAQAAETAQAQAAIKQAAETARIEIEKQNAIEKQADWENIWRPLLIKLGIILLGALTGALVWAFYSLGKLLAVSVSAYIDRQRSVNLESLLKVTPQGIIYWTEDKDGNPVLSFLQPPGREYNRLTALDAAKIAFEQQGVRTLGTSGSTLLSPLRRSLTAEELQALAISLLRRGKPESNVIPGHRGQMGGGRWEIIVIALELAGAAYTKPGEGTYVTPEYSTVGNLLAHLESGAIKLSPPPRDNGAGS